MQAIVLAAGFGSRLGDLTVSIPKPMVPITKNSTMLSMILTNLEAVNVSRAVIMVGHAYGAIESWIASNAGRYSYDIVTEPVHDIAGSNAGTLLDGLAAYGSDTTIVHNGDTLTSQETLVELDIDRGHIGLAVDTKSPLTDEAMKTAIEDGIVRRVSKRLKTTEAQGEYIGISVIPLGLIDLVAEKLETLIDVGSDEYYEDAYDAIAFSTDLVAPLPIPSHPWIEVDTPQDLVAARQLFSR